MSSLACVILLGWIQISAFQQKNVQIAKYKFRAGVILSEWVYICDLFSWPYLRQREKNLPLSIILGWRRVILQKIRVANGCRHCYKTMAPFPFCLHPLYADVLPIHEAFLFLSSPHIPFVSILSVFPLFFLLFLLEGGKGVYVAMSTCI